MTYLALRIIATLFITIGTYIFLEGTDSANTTVTQDEARLIPIIKYLVLVARGFEIFVIWVIR